ncbi:MAG: aminopeptidase P family protein [Nitrospira sp.]|nr:aminopeptidase P family protein [Nitrospira sp.]MDE0404829.1 aminopeptidase P family protein [Nitrospira sp.]MDE0485358.1 aminopeptidase P family protein [Nitrospira sp.]
MTAERIQTFRAEITRQGLSGFIVPHADEYQNEYVPACAERLAWLTGFTGSAGTAVVLTRQAAIFVDGRYTLQVRSQVDAQVWTPKHLMDEAVHSWLPTVLRRGDKLGYDPWLHTLQEVEQLKESCTKAGAVLTPCEPNPIDALWDDRPAPPAAKVVSHDLAYAGKSSDDKRQELAAKLKNENVGVAVLTAPDSIAWLLNVRGGDVEHTPLPLGFALLHCDGTASLFLDLHKVSDSLTSHLGPAVRIRPVSDFHETLDQLGKAGERVLCDSNRTASWISERLARSGARVIEGEDPCLLPKACKNVVEINGAREAQKRDGAAVCEFLAWLNREAPKGKLSELDAQAYLDACRRRQPLWQDMSFPTISAAGPNGAVVHYRASDEQCRRLEPGTLYLVDSGGQYLDGTTDVTRTIAIGSSTAEHRDRYTRVLKGHIALALATFPKGTTGAQLDTLARQPLWEVGLDYAHGTGHGVGSYLGVHEGPQRISKGGHTVALQPGMILSNEPGYYKNGEYGIRLENLVVVIPAKMGGGGGREWLAFETITLVPFDASLIDRSLLNAAEREWLNAYHARVREVIGPLVDSSTAVWLEQATERIA